MFHIRYTKMDRLFSCYRYAKSGVSTGLFNAPIAILAFAALFQASSVLSQDATNPASCGNIWEAIGLPEAEKDLSPNGGLTVCHKGFITFHNNNSKIPDWVLQRMTREQVSGTIRRKHSNFREESEAPRDKRAKNLDYTNSGYDRGHLAASADYNFDIDFMKDTFVFSNAVPQHGAGFNSGIWSSLERLTRELAKERGILLVHSGPVYQTADRPAKFVLEGRSACNNKIEIPIIAKKSICDENDRDKSAACEAGVQVPSALFKILYDPERNRANAYLFPNISHTKLKRSTTTAGYLKKHRVTVELVEELSGYDFFPTFTARQQRVREQACAATFFH